MGCDRRTRRTYLALRPPLRGSFHLGFLVVVVVHQYDLLLVLLLLLPGFFLFPGLPLPLVQAVVIGWSSSALIVDSTSIQWSVVVAAGGLPPAPPPITIPIPIALTSWW